MGDSLGAVKEMSKTCLLPLLFLSHMSGLSASNSIRFSLEVKFEAVEFVFLLGGSLASVFCVAWTSNHLLLPL